MRHSEKRATGQKRWILAALILSAAIIILILYGFLTELREQMDRTKSLQANWNIETPKADRYDDVLWFSGRDPTHYYLAVYNEESLASLSQLVQWEPISSMAPYVDSLVDKFFQGVKQWYPEDVDLVERALKEYPVVFDKDDLYWILRQEDGSQFLAILNLDTRTMYAMESFR